MGRGGVDAFANGRQVQFFRWTDVFALFDLDQAARIFFVVRHYVTDCDSFAPSGLVHFLLVVPTASPWAAFLRRFAASLSG